MVSEGWLELRLDEICSKKIVYGIVQAGEHVEDGVPYIKSSDVGREINTFGLSKTAPEIHRKFGRSSVHPGDIVFSLRGNTGSTSIVPDDLPEANLTQGTARLTISPEYDTRFVRFMLGSSSIMRQVLAVAKGSTFTEVSLEALRKITLAAPPLPEQQKIAEILGTWDKAIETTEALLANARTQKRALMQSLLTGTRRFPGFEDHPWREVRLQQIADIIVSNVDKKSEPNELPVRLCNYTDVYKNDTIRADMDFMEATATSAQVKKFGLKVGDVIITKDSEDSSDIAVPAYVAETADDLVCGYHLAIIRANDHADGRFLKYCFELPHTRYYFGARANGATRFGLNIDSIETAIFRVPSVAEQRIIADAIQVAEQEIGHITDALSHLRTEKKSLMQQLLTGKRRVKS